MIIRLHIFICVALILTSSQAAAVNVDDFGASGDGTTWDHAAIQAAISAAGPNGLVEFSAGKTYVICRRLLPVSGQTLRGNGAILKRCDAVTAVLTQDATAGSRLLMVDDAAVFEFGQSLTPVKGAGGYADGEFVIDHYLQSVDGQAVTISNELRQDYPAGSTVTVKFDQIYVSNTSTNVTIENFVFDGNRENNHIYLSWTDNKAIRGYSDLIIRDSTFHNLPGNGVTAFGTNVLIADNVFIDLDGPIVHLSGNWPVDGSSVTIARNLVANTNAQADRMQHSEGVITISAYNYSINVLDNVVDNATVPFISRFHAEMSDWLIRGNRVSGTAGIFFAKVWPGEALADIRFEDNVFRNVGASRSLRREGAEPIIRFDFINNQILGGSLSLEGLDDSDISGNTIRSCGVEPVQVTGSSNVDVVNNDTDNEYCLLTLQLESVPASLIEPGGDVTFGLDVVNTAENGDIAAVHGIDIRNAEGVMSGDIGSECFPLLPATILQGESIRCTFVTPMLGIANDVLREVISVSGKLISNGNVVVFQAEDSVRIGSSDFTPPDPIEMSFQVPPESAGSDSITMTATTATDVSGVEYLFTNTAGGTSSGWQDSPTYVDTGLDPDTSYSYTVTARDKSANKNETLPSSAFSATTDSLPDTSPPVISLIGPSEYTIFAGADYVDPGATAEDDRDGDMSARIVMDTSSVITSSPGSYVVTYDVSDTAGNAAVQVTRTVVVLALPDTGGGSIDILFLCLLTCCALAARFRD